MKKINKTIQERIKKKQGEWLEAFKTQWTISGTCRNIGISRDTYYEWIKKYPEFLKRKKEIEEDQIDYAETKLYRAIDAGNLKAITFFLKSRSKKWRPVEKREVEEKTESRRLKELAESLKKIAERKYNGEEKGQG